MSKAIKHIELLHKSFNDLVDILNEVAPEGKQLYANMLTEVNKNLSNKENLKMPEIFITMQFFQKLLLTLPKDRLKIFREDLEKQIKEINDGSLEDNINNMWRW